LKNKWWDKIKEIWY